MAKLYFRYGSVGSAKTMNLLAVAHNYEQQGKRVFLIKPALDERFNANRIKSRAGLERDADLLVDSDSTIDVSLLSGTDCVLVDECQFLSGTVICQLRNITVDLGIPVICYGLRTNFRTELFEGSKRLMEIADAIEEVKTTCAFCNRKGVFNLRHVNGKGVLSGAEISLGTEERYLPTCCPCYESSLGVANPLRCRRAGVELWLVRHGQTTANYGNILSGWGDVELTAEGRRQAESLRAVLGDVEFTGVYSSDLQRAAETARLAYGEPVQDERLREIFFGDYDGLPISEIDPEWVRRLYEFNEVEAPGGESVEGVRRRVMDFIEELPPGRHLIFCHGGVIRGLSVHLGEDRFVQNAEILRIDWSGQRLL